MELWDLYDANRYPLDRTHVRGKKLAPGEYHVVVSILTVNDAGQLLLTLRHPDKKDFANLWENTAGSLLAGEDSLSGAVRELYEETGICAMPEEMTLLRTQRERTAFVNTYLVRKSPQISQLTMQEGETAAAQWVTLSQLNRMLSDREIAAPVARRMEQMRTELEQLLR